MSNRLISISDDPELIGRFPNGGPPNPSADESDPETVGWRKRREAEREARLRRQMAASLMRPWRTVREVSRAILARRGER